MQGYLVVIKYKGKQLKRLSSFAGIKPKSPPRGFQGELREYQREGLGWLHFLRSASCR